MLIVSEGQFRNNRKLPKSLFWRSIRSNWTLSALSSDVVLTSLKEATSHTKLLHRSQCPIGKLRFWQRPINQRSWQYETKVGMAVQKGQIFIDIQRQTTFKFEQDTRHWSNRRSRYTGIRYNSIQVLLRFKFRFSLIARSSIILDAQVEKLKIGNRSSYRDLSFCLSTIQGVPCEANQAIFFQTIRHREKCFK